MKVTAKHLIVANSIKQQAINEHWQRNYRIPTQRELARKLGTSLQTINLAIKYLERSGSVKSVKGSGCYWNKDGSSPKDGLVDLTVFETPRILFDRGQDEFINIDESLDYLNEHILSWIRTRGASPTTNEDSFQLTHSASSALLLATTLAKQSTEAILCEPLVDGGLLHAAKALGIKLIPCPYDREGMIPEEMLRLIRQHDIKALYICPSGSNPLCSFARIQRRKDWVQIAEQYRCLVIENHSLAPFSTRDIESMHALLPQQTLQIQSFSSQLSDSIDMGALIGNESLIRVANPYINTLGCAPSKSSAYFFYQLIFEGRHQSLFDMNKKWLARRADIAKEYLISPHPMRHFPTHIWFDWPTCEQVLLSLQYKNIRLAGEKAFTVGDEGSVPTGFRMSIMNNSSDEEFTEVVREISNALKTSNEVNDGII